MSEIKVNKISPKQTCTTVTLGDSGDDFVVATGANLKTAAVKDTSGNVIISRCGSNITIGSSGAAIALACGATQTGFGRTGTVDWDTTAKTGNFTAVSGNGYFVNTTSGAITVTLPATPSAGDIVAIKDYANTADTNNITIARNGSNIDGTANNPIISNEGGSITLVYVDSTKGWLVTDAAQKSDLTFPAFIVATGGTISCCGDYKIHTFTGPGTFTVCSLASASPNNIVDYMVVAGGGGGASQHSGGGGAGGLRFSASTYTAPCTAAPRAGTTLPVSVTSYPITVGGGGAARPGTGSPTGVCSEGNPGSNSVFSTITSTAGGGGGGYYAPRWDGLSGGSGGGGGSLCGSGGAGNTPPVSPSQGNNGGNGGPGIFTGGGGGGAGAVGDNSGPPQAGNGGVGLQVNINGTGHYWSGGGAGGSESSRTGGNGGLGGGGGGGSMPAGTQGTGGGSALNPGANAVSGDGGAGGTNTGGGGGASGGNTKTGATGGSGIVIIRYKFQ